jgi:hypothetical protein
MPAAATPDLMLKPRLHGVLHQWAFLVSLAAGVRLVLGPGSTRARVAVAVYVLSVAASSVAALSTSNLH